MRDPVALAAAVLADPRHRVSADDMQALCRALVDAARVPQISNELADAVRNLIAAESAHTMAKGPDGYAPLKLGLAREMAFLTFKQIFTEEFPDA